MNSTDVTRFKLGTANLHPLVVLIDIDVLRTDDHLSEHLHGSHSLESDNAGTHENHEQSDHRINSVLVKKPKTNAEELEEGKWFDKLVSEKGLEFWSWNTESILVIKREFVGGHLVEIFVEFDCLVDLWLDSLEIVKLVFPNVLLVVEVEMEDFSIINSRALQWTDSVYSVSSLLS